MQLALKRNIVQTFDQSYHVGDRWEQIFGADWLPSFQKVVDFLS